MQQKLYFPRETARRAGGSRDLHAEPPGPGLPRRPAIAVDLENNVTRVLNSDYFGESKKGGLRMWNNIVFDKGGLALHAGLKVIPTAAATRCS